MPTASTSGSSLMTQGERGDCMTKLGDIARRIAEQVCRMVPAEISDTVVVSGHQFSTVDDTANLAMRQFVTSELGERVQDIIEESELPRASQPPTGSRFPLLVADTVEGSFNAARGLGSLFNAFGRRPIQAGTSLMLLEAEQLGSIAATAFYDWASHLLFTSVRGEPGSFLAFIDSRIVHRPAMGQARSQPYIVVPNYSHTNVDAHADVIRALQAKGLRCIGGTQSSAQDLLDVLWGRADAYLDLRHLFPSPAHHRDAVLRAWDVGALLPFLHSCGFIITDHTAESWHMRSYHDSLVLIVTASTELWQRIKEAIRNVSFMPHAEDDQILTVKMPSASI